MMPSGAGGEDTSFSIEESMEMITEETSLSSSSYHHHQEHQLYEGSPTRSRHHHMIMSGQKKISGVDLSKHSELTPATQSTTESPYSSSSITSAIDDFDAPYEQQRHDDHDAAYASSFSSSSSSPYAAVTSSSSPVSLCLRMGIPRAARPSIDPRYARRLPPPPPNHRRTTSSSSPPRPMHHHHVLTPPPMVQRSIFRHMMPTTSAATGTYSSGGGGSFADGRLRPAERQHGMMAAAAASTTTTTDPSSSSPLRLPPPSKRARSTGDRYIPSRGPYHNYDASQFDTGLWGNISRPRDPTHASSGGGGGTADTGGADGDAAAAASAAASSTMDQDIVIDRSNVFSSVLHRNTLTSLLQSEVLGRDENELPRLRFSSAASFHGTAAHAAAHSSSQHHHGLQHHNNAMMDSTSIVNSFGLSPVSSPASQRLIAVPSKRKRKIPKVPFKVLDAPALQDDFYLNLVDWSSQNVLAVGLGSCVYLWSACTSKVTKLCDLIADEDTVTAVSWAQRGIHLSVGTNKGEVQLWDTVRCKKIRSMGGHTARVGTLAWTGPLLASGSRDRLIYLRDVRVQDHYTHKLSTHRQEVCGLRWSFEEPAFLASGGNDNNLHVVDSRNPAEPLHRFTDHTAAVKAIAWSPHQHGLLASGGGTADRCIRFWNTLSGASLNKIDTGSQVCNLAWSQNCNEIVSTHGYSLNQVVVWRYPSMSKVTTLTGHTYRVLYLAMSPDGSTVVTGAGDETLRFWQVFPGPRSDTKSGSNSLLFPQTVGSVIR